MIDKLKQLWFWTKRKFKEILIILGVLGVASAAALLPSGIIPSVMVNGQMIEFPYTDSDSGENLPIYTDKQTYSNGDYIYLAFNNKDVLQLADIQFYFKNGEITEISKLAQDVPYQIDVPDYATTTYDCSYYEWSNGSTTKTLISKTCEKQEQIGSHKETRYKDEWTPQTLTAFSDKDYNPSNLTVKDKKELRAEKKTQIVLPEGYSYFRGKIRCPMWKINDEFFVEAIGSTLYAHLDPFLTGYSYRRVVSIDKTKIDAALTSFPVAVIFTSSTIDFSKAQSDGDDIRFTDSGGTTTLNYERERHDATNGLAEYWVMIPSIVASTTGTTTFYIYYGNASAENGAATTSVWDANYVGVYHKKDLTTTSTADSTTNGYTGTKIGANEPIEADAKIAKGQQYDGSNDYIINGTMATFGSSAGATISCWVTKTGNKLQGVVVDWGGGTNQRIYIIFLADGQIESTIYTSGGNSGWDSVTTYGNNTWYHIAVAWASGGTHKLYVNGAYVCEGASITGTMRAATNNMWMGGQQGFTRYLGGKIDEVRFSTVGRSVAWIKADYNSGNNTLLTIGTEESGVVRRIILIE